VASASYTYIVTTPARLRRWIELAAEERAAEQAHSRDEVEEIWRRQDKLAESFSARFTLEGITGLEIGLLLATLGERGNVYDVETLCHEEGQRDPVGVCIDGEITRLLAISELPETAAREWSELIDESFGQLHQPETLRLSIDRLQSAARLAVERGEHIYSLPTGSVPEGD
jgi:hypothetical protein